MAILIRPARESDESAIYTLLDHENPWMEENHPYHPSKVTSLIMNALRDPRSKERCWVAEADGKPVGFVRTENLGGGVFVEKDYQGNGIGAALVTTRENFLKEQGQRSFLMRVFADNAGAIKCYKKLGYEFDEASRNEIQNLEKNPIENNKVPVLTMTKNLDCFVADAPCNDEFLIEKPTPPTQPRRIGRQ